MYRYLHVYILEFAKKAGIEYKRIQLNIKLAKKPEQCLEYIIVHKMTHFLERDHNSRCVAYMDKFMPKREIYKNELNSEILAHEKW